MKSWMMSVPDRLSLKLKCALYAEIVHVFVTCTSTTLRFHKLPCLKQETQWPAYRIPPWSNIIVQERSDRHQHIDWRRSEVLVFKNHMSQANIPTRTLADCNNPPPSNINDDPCHRNSMFTNLKRQKYQTARSSGKMFVGDRYMWMIMHVNKKNDC